MDILFQNLSFFVQNKVRIAPHSLLRGPFDISERLDAGERIEQIAPEVTTTTGSAIYRLNLFKTDVFSLGMLILSLGLSGEYERCYDWVENPPTLDYNSLHRNLERFARTYSRETTEMIKIMLADDPALRPDAVGLYNLLQNRLTLKTLSPDRILHVQSHSLSQGQSITSTSAQPQLVGGYRLLMPALGIQPNPVIAPGVNPLGAPVVAPLGTAQNIQYNQVRMTPPRVMTSYGVSNSTVQFSGAYPQVSAPYTSINGSLYGHPPIHVHSQSFSTVQNQAPVVQQPPVQFTGETKIVQHPSGPRVTTKDQIIRKRPPDSIRQEPSRELEEVSQAETARFKSNELRAEVAQKLTVDLVPQSQLSDAIKRKFVNDKVESTQRVERLGTIQTQLKITTVDRSEVGDPRSNPSSVKSRVEGEITYQREEEQKLVQEPPKRPIMQPSSLTVPGLAGKIAPTLSVDEEPPEEEEEDYPTVHEHSVDKNRISQESEEHKGSDQNEEKDEEVRGPEEEIVVEEYPDGSRFEGAMVDGIRNGFGKFYYGSGGVYEGNWKGGKMNGYGKLFYANGTLAYEGEWKDEKFQGKGTLYNDSPQEGVINYQDLSNVEQTWRSYEGDFVEDCKEGKGTSIFSDGSKYVGEFKADAFHGKGTFTKSTGETITGVWNNNLFVSNTD
eukprot:TRINITY_DN3089_c0_g3_i3.p1 TRINITY_DN3089_c0_g3~~TRINITY_DN3089_c0_g3_i3.p1  ORF type:complete len:669 (-),score=108.68 TRINITY_DN3089_c0_g3_i3:27-2033(-)